MLRKSLIVAIALFGLTAAAPRAEAAPVTCPMNPLPSERVFTLSTPGAVCAASGVGNLSGNNDYINDVLNGVDFWTTIDKSDDAVTGTFPSALTITGGGALAGTFSFSSQLWSTYDRLIIALKSGQGQLDPDWGAFELPTNVTSGSWTISGQQGLSHINLYGHVGVTKQDIPPPTVPEPTTLVLFGSSLALAARRLRRSRQ